MLLWHKGTLNLVLECNNQMAAQHPQKRRSESVKCWKEWFALMFPHGIDFIDALEPVMTHSFQALWMCSYVFEISEYSFVCADVLYVWIDFISETHRLITLKAVQPSAMTKTVVTGTMWHNALRWHSPCDKNKLDADLAKSELFKFFE